MKTLKSILTATLITIATSCSPAFAEGFLDAPDKALEDQWMVAIGGWSKHVLGFSDGVTNETHNIFAVEHDSYSAGYFRNSYGNDTVFVAKTWRKELFDHVEGSISLGVNYGYEECMGHGDGTKNVCPHGWVGVSFTKYRVVPSLKVLPGLIVTGKHPS